MDNKEENSISAPSNDKGKKKQEELTLAEYKLVPVEEIESIEDEERPIDLIKEIKNLWIQKKTILTVASIILGIGLVIFLFSERMYSSQITLMPEATTPESTANQLLRQYGGFLGIGGDQGMVSETISVDLYPEIIISLPFQLELIQEELYFSGQDTTASLFDYYDEVRQPSLLERSGDFLWNITLGLPGTVKGLFVSGNTAQPDLNFGAYMDREGPLDVDGRIKKVISYTSGLISVEQEPQTGFVVIRAELPDPQASAQLVKAVKKLLTEYVVEYRTEKAMTDMEFVRRQYEEAKRQFKGAQDSLANFRDRNQNLVTARAMTLEQRLQAEYDLRFDVYNSLAQRLEQSKLKVQEETPVFSTLEPVTISNSPSFPDPKIIFIGSVFLGLFFGVVFVYGRTFYVYFRQEFESK